MLVALLAATITPAIIIFFITLMHGGSSDPEMVVIFCFFALLISAAHVLLLGLPSIMLLKSFNFINLLSLSFAGILIGSIISGINDWPLSNGHYIGTITSEFYGMTVVKAVNGVPTPFGWLIYFQKTILFGCTFGLPSSLAFWMFWKSENA